MENGNENCILGRFDKEPWQVKPPPKNYKSEITYDYVHLKTWMHILPRWGQNVPTIMIATKWRF